jgi:hypothetical protein
MNNISRLIAQKTGYEELLGDVSRQPYDSRLT